MIKALQALEATEFAFLQRIIYKFTISLFQGKRLEENVGGGVLLHNHTLVVQQVSLDQAGLYTCVASNTVADGESNALHLDIKCKKRTMLQFILPRNPTLHKKILIFLILMVVALSKGLQSRSKVYAE